MLNLKSVAKSTSRRRESLAARISSTKEELAAMEKEMAVLDAILKAVAPGGLSPVLGRPRGKKRRGGKWRKGHPGRPPKWFTEQQKAKGKSKAAKPAKKASKAKPAKRKRKASEKQLAAMAKARAALAAKRAAAATPPPSSP